MLKFVSCPKCRAVFQAEGAAGCPRCAPPLVIEPDDPLVNTMTATQSLPVDDDFARFAAPADTRACPWCAETIKAKARICRFCNRALDEPATRPVVRECENRRPPRPRRGPRRRS